jgi:putative hemolysin
MCNALAARNTLATRNSRAICSAVSELWAVSRLPGRRARYRDATTRSAHMRRGKINRVLAMVAFAALAGCASVAPKVVPAGDDAYRLSLSGARYESQAATNSKALNIASDYCAKMGKHLMFRQSTESGDHSWDPKQEDLTFVCIDA